MNFCLDCKHYIKPNLCVSPVNHTSPVDGGPKPLFANLCRTYSDLGNSCGPDGKYFEAKPKPKKPWWAVWRTE